jgi:hypothetical protein
MDMLASLIASNYALYANNPRHLGMWLPPTHHQSTTFASLLHPYSPTNNGQLIQMPIVNSSAQEQVKRDTVKFSIENILKDKTSAVGSEDGRQTQASEENCDKAMVGSRQFSWLQCTRYKPPKLPRE